MSPYRSPGHVTRAEKPRRKPCAVGGGLLLFAVVLILSRLISAGTQVGAFGSTFQIVLCVFLVGVLLRR